MWDTVDVAMDNSSSGTLPNPNAKCKKDTLKNFLYFPKNVSYISG